MDIQNLVLASFVLFEASTFQRNTFAAADNQQHTLCRGSSFGLSTVHSSAQLYEFYRAKYSNCTYVDGNLELVDLDQNYDLSFLRDIHEVTGYVLIKSVMSEFIRLENLRIIRGQLLLSQGGRNYSLYVETNYNDKGIGLKELQLTSLREIMYGDVYFHDNRLLCHERTIEWRDILPPTSVVRFNDTLPKMRNCQECDAKCTYNRMRHCWGSGPDQCQSITKLNCSEQCLFRCLPGSPHVCCHSECAGGCTGPTSSMCWACKNFANDQFCVNACPPRTTYDPITFKRYPNPDFKYIHGSICLRNCPKHLYSDESACIRECSNSMAVDGNCIPCAGICPIKCPGIKPPEYVHSGNIASFHGCNIVQNSVSILKETFTGDWTRNVSGLSESDLSVFETVTEITGYLQIEAEAVTHVDYFRNLTVIRGIETIPRSAISLKIYGTWLESLNFQSLKEIRSGSVIVENNTRLCFADDINWEKLFSLPEQMISVSSRAKDSCAKDGHVCSLECSSDGCWGPRDDQCLSCAHFRLGRRCIGSCDIIPRLYQSSRAECQWCHEECKTKCSDNSSMTCDECRHFKDGQQCVATCPEDKYADDRGLCQPCHSNCQGGCTGGKNTVGLGGCRSCSLIVLDSSDNVTGCVDVTSNCGDGFYKKTIYDHPDKELNGKQACKQCHPECRICNEFGLSLSSCESCLHYQQEDRCVRSCPTDYFVKDGMNICLRCDSRCLHCSGPTASDCTVCKQYVVYNDADDHGKGFNCTETCPDHIPHKMIEETASKEKVTVCVKEDISMNATTIAKIVGSVIGGVIILSVVIIAIVAVLYKRAKAEANKVRLTAQLFGVPEAELLVPPVVNPDLAKLRLIKESELRRGAVIGSGAFGSVYRGMWIPENESVKLIVAIKVLNEGLSANQTLDLLNEVRIMASVNDQYCIRILAFCMTSQMMIVTQLMPHGCLLDFVRKHKAEIGSQVLLNWCTQIAKGMMYLEERSIVHRDLAARNILVQHPEHIRITDFGLSKLLDHNESEVHSTEEKVPIKWMALESIQFHCFTHKSDVWSYGVTLWELFTKGCVPYENICPSAIPDLLEKGERLAQPAICTIDVYMLMIKCWVIDYSSRPGFRYFAEEFAKMARDPGRYLVIEGDEFMRISSPIIGVKELMRYASIDSGGTEMIIAPDDYLRPSAQRRSGGSHSQNDLLETVEEMASDSDAAGTSNNVLNSSVSFPGENGHRSAIGQRLRRNARNRGAANVTRQHSEPRGGQQNIRYCSDPCKAAILQQQRLPVDNTPPPPYSQADPTVAARGDVKSNPRDPVQGSGAANPVVGRGTGVSRVQSQEIPLSPRFPVERKPPLGHEDYLQPAGQYSTAYDDLLNNASGENSPGVVTTSFISNPEYFEDIPSIPSNAAGNVRTHRRSESNDSAKYYNEFAPGARNSSAAHKGV